MDETLLPRESRRNASRIIGCFATVAITAGLLVFTFSSNTTNDTTNTAHMPRIDWPWTCSPNPASGVADEKWCKNNCGPNWDGSRPGGCYGENDCEGIPFCDEFEKPNGNAPCTCTSGDGPTPTAAPTAAPQRRRGPSPPPPSRRRSPSPPGSVKLGGWCSSHWGACDWPHNIDTVLPGGFQPNPADGPITGWYTSVDDLFLTMGGEGVGNKGQWPCFDPKELIKMASALGAKGIAYDMEGCYKDSTQDVKELVKKIKELDNGNLKHMYVPQGDGATIPDDDTFDYLAPMLYWGATSYQQSVTWSKVNSWRNLWKNDGWNPSKTYLTYQSYSAVVHYSNHGQEVIEGLASTAKQEQYRGIIGWYSTTAEHNTKNINRLRDLLA